MGWLGDLSSGATHRTVVDARIDRATQYSAAPVTKHERRGVLDHPLSRMMTVECVAGPRSSRLPAHELVGAKLAGDLVEHRVHHAGLLSLDKGMRDIDIFRHHDAAGHILAMLQFVGAGAQHRAQYRVAPLQRPTFLEAVGDP